RPPLRRPRRPVQGPLRLALERRAGPGRRRGRAPGPEGGGGRGRVSAPLRLLVFGYGYLGGAARRRLGRDGWTASVTARDAERRATLAAEGVEALDPADAPALARAFRGADAVLVTAPPDADGC